MNLRGLAAYAGAACLSVLAAGCGTSEETMRDLRSPNALQQIRAIDEIIKHRQARDDAVALLALRLESPVPQVSVRAAHALGVIGERGLPALTRALKSPEPETRWKAVCGLAAAGSAARDAFPALLNALLDSDPQVRQEAAVALGRMGAHDAIVALKARRDQEEDPAAREAIAGALQMLGAETPAAPAPARTIESRGEAESPP